MRSAQPWANGLQGDPSPLNKKENEVQHEDESPSKGESILGTDLKRRKESRISSNDLMDISVNTLHISLEN